MKRYSAPSPLYPVSVVAKIMNRSIRTIQNKVKKDSSFPQPIKVNGKIVGWVPKDVEEWNLKKTK